MGDRGRHQFPSGLEWLIQQAMPNIPTAEKIKNIKVRYYAPDGEPKEEFIKAEVQRWRASPDYKQLGVAWDYYQNKNDINNRVRYTLNGRGNKVKSKLSNTKRSHPFFRELVDQRVRYLLAKPFSIKTDISDIGAQYDKALKPYFDDGFRRKFKNLGRHTIIDGLGWLQVAYNSNGDLTFTRVPEKEIIPFWADSDHTILDALIRAYDIVVFNGNEDVVITKIQFHSRDGIWYYLIDDKGFRKDDSVPEVQADFTVAAVDEEGKIRLDEEGKEVNVDMMWDRIPFIPFKANSDELGLLSLVKSLVDDYDANSSDLSNLFKDQPESIKVVKDYDGTDVNEFLQRLMDYRTAFVKGDGDLRTIQDIINAANVYLDLNEVRKNIYHFGSAVDYSVQNFGNATGVGLKFLYGKLDAAASDMANEFQASFEKLLWFINQDILLKGGPDFTEQKASLVFNIDQIINETETISNVRNSLGLISNKTAVENHPWVENVEEELDAVKQDTKDKMQQQIEMFGLPDANENPPGDEE